MTEVEADILAYIESSVKNRPSEAPFNQNERRVIAAFHSYEMGDLRSSALEGVMRPIPLNDMACDLGRLHVSSGHGHCATTAMDKYIDIMHDKIKGGDSFSRMII